MLRRSGIAALTIGAVLVTAALVPATSASAAKAKKKPTYKVSASASATTVKTSHTVSISGAVMPKSRASVKLQRYSAGAWRTVASKKLPKSSKYSFTVNVGATPGAVSYRVTKAKTKKIKAGVSKSVKVNVVTWGTVKSWGVNDDGVLGAGLTAGATQRTPVSVKGLTEVVQVSAHSDSDTAYARRYDGTVWSWGSGNAGQLGNGTTTAASLTPVKVNNLKNITSIAGGGAFGLALRADGTVWAWGENEDRQLGLGTSTTDQTSPAPVAGLTKVVKIAAGYATGYAVKSDGTVWAWGYGNLGDLGQGVGGSTADAGIPLQVPGLSGITDVASCGDTAYALGAYGTIYAWGYNSNGELGAGVAGAYNPTPKLVAGITGARLSGTPFDTAFAITTGGTVHAWGIGSSGQLGNGDDSDSSVPVLVDGLSGVRQTAGADSTGFALLSNGTVRSWGDGQATGVTATDDRLVPGAVPGLAGVTGISGAYRAGFAVIG